jgi:hypothetical protein
MRQTKSMSPLYAIRWWKRRKLRPPELQPLDFMLKRLAWRYAKGLPETVDSRIYLGDSTAVIPRVSKRWVGSHRPARLLLTSPPYFGVTNYHYDQWLRLWLLGGPPTSRRPGGLHRGKFENKEQYHQLLLAVFGKARALLSRDAVIYVRTDSRELTLRMTTEALRDVFPHRRIRHQSRPHTRPTQTKLFGHADPQLGEIDLVLT